MKALLKILLTIAMLNAAARVGLAATSYYQFKDASQEILTFGGQSSPGDLQRDIYRKAQELKVPLGMEDVQVTRNGYSTSAAATYTQPVEVFPSFIYPVPFRFSIEAVSMAGLRQGVPPRR